MYNLLEKSCLYIIETLYHQSVFCIILFILIFGFSKIFKGRSPHWLLGLWFLILIRLVLPTDLSLSFSARHLADDFLSAHNVDASLEEVSDRLTTKYIPDQAVKLKKSIWSAGETRAGTPTIPEAHENNNMSLSWPVKLSIFWLFGALIFLTLFLYKIRSIERVLDYSSLVRDKNTIAIVDYWRRSFKIRRQVTIYSSDKFLSPFTTGLFRPKIFIPESLLKGMDNETINSIVAHEMVHIKHFDHAWIRFQNVLQILYFFNPIVWYVNSQINIERDRLCDSLVMARHVIPPKAFGKSVIDVLKFNLSGYRMIEPLLCFSNHKNIYEYRIRDILKGKTISKPKSLAIFLLVFLMGLFLLPMSNANIKSKKPEISEEILSLNTEKFKAGTEFDKVIAEVPDDDITPLPGINIIKEKNTGQKAGNEDISTQAGTENYEESLISDSIKEKVDVFEKRTGRSDKIETGFPNSSAETFEKNEAPLKTASNEEKVNSPENRTPKNNKAISEQPIKSHEPVKQSRNPSVDYFSKGMFHLKNGEVEDAIADLTKAIELNPENAVAYFSRGNAYFKKGQAKKAISDYDKAIEITPGYTDVYFSRGYYYQTIGEYQKAISDYNEVISIRPRNAHAYNYRGSAYFIQEKYREAFSDFNKAIELNPGFAAAYQNRGSVYYRMGKQRKAISDYNKSIALNPNLAASYQDRGNIFMNQDRFDEAISDYNKLLELNPEDSFAYNSRGIAYFAQEQYQKAFNDFNKVIALDPEYASSYFFRGYYYQMTGKYSKAVSDYKKALSLNPQIEPAKKLLKEAEQLLANVESENIETDGDQKLVCRWVMTGKKKSKECRTKQEWARLQNRGSWTVNLTPYPQSSGGKTHTVSEYVSTYRAF